MGRIEVAKIGRSWTARGYSQTLAPRLERANFEQEKTHPRSTTDVLSPPHIHDSRGEVSSVCKDHTAPHRAVTHHFGGDLSQHALGSIATNRGCLEAIQMDCFQQHRLLSRFVFRLS